jgi:replicative DNA helicase
VKSPPYSVASEKIVLGSVLTEPLVLREIKPILTDGRVFFRPEHGRLYNLLIELCQKQPPLDPEQIIGAVAGKPFNEEQLQEIAGSAVDRRHAVDQAEIVAEKARMRALIDALSDLVHDAYHSPDGFAAIVARARARLDQLCSQSPQESLKGRRK